MKERTEHCLKNRFFGVMSKFSSIPIRKIKQDKSYLSKKLIEEALKFHKDTLDFEKKDGVETEESMLKEAEKENQQQKQAFFKNEIVVNNEIFDSNDEVFDSFFTSRDTLPSMSDF